MTIKEWSIAFRLFLWKVFSKLWLPLLIRIAGRFLDIPLDFDKHIGWKDGHFVLKDLRLNLYGVNTLLADSQHQQRLAARFYLTDACVDSIEISIPLLSIFSKGFRVLMLINGLTISIACALPPTSQLSKKSQTQNTGTTLDPSSSQCPPPHPSSPWPTLPAIPLVSSLLRDIARRTELLLEDASVSLTIPTDSIGQSAHSPPTSTSLGLNIAALALSPSGSDHYLLSLGGFELLAMSHHASVSCGTDSKKGCLGHNPLFVPNCGLDTTSIGPPPPPLSGNGDSSSFGNVMASSFYHAGVLGKSHIRLKNSPPRPGDGGDATSSIPITPANQSSSTDTTYFGDTASTFANPETPQRRKFGIRRVQRPKRHPLRPEAHPCLQTKKRIICLRGAAHIWWNVRLALCIFQKTGLAAQGFTENTPGSRPPPPPVGNNDPTLSSAQSITSSVSKASQSSIPTLASEPIPSGGSQQSSVSSSTDVSITLPPCYVSISASDILTYFHPLLLLSKRLEKYELAQHSSLPSLPAPHLSPSALGSPSLERWLCQLPLSVHPTCTLATPPRAHLIRNRKLPASQTYPWRIRSSLSHTEILLAEGFEDEAFIARFLGWQKLRGVVVEQEESSRLASNTHHHAAGDDQRYHSHSQGNGISLGTNLRRRRTSNPAASSMYGSTEEESKTFYNAHNYHPDQTFSNYFSVHASSNIRLSKLDFDEDFFQNFCKYGPPGYSGDGTLVVSPIHLETAIRGPLFVHAPPKSTVRNGGGNDVLPSDLGDHVPATSSSFTRAPLSIAPIHIRFHLKWEAIIVELQAHSKFTFKPFSFVPDGKVAFCMTPFLQPPEQSGLIVFGVENIDINAVTILNMDDPKDSNSTSVSSVVPPAKNSNLQHAAAISQGNNNTHVPHMTANSIPFTVQHDHPPPSNFFTSSLNIMNNNSRSSPSNIDTTCMNQPSSHLNILLTPPQMGENSCTVIPSSHMNILNNVAANPNVIKKTKTPDICSSSIPNSITDRLNSNNSFPPATANCSRDMQSYASVLSNLRISLGRVRLETIHQSRALDESSSKSKLTHKFDAAKFAADFESELQSSTTEPSSQASSDCETTHDEVEDNSESEGNNIFTLEALPGIIPITMSNSAAILPSHQLKLRRKLMAREAKLNLPPGTLIERYERRLREENEIRRAGCHQDDASASSSASSIVSEAFEDVAIDLVEHFRRLKVFKKIFDREIEQENERHDSSCVIMQSNILDIHDSNVRSCSALATSESTMFPNSAVLLTLKSRPVSEKSAHAQQRCDAHRVSVHVHLHDVDLSATLRPIETIYRTLMLFSLSTSTPAPAVLDSPVEMTTPPATPQAFSGLPSVRMSVSLVTCETRDRAHPAASSSSLGGLLVLQNISCSLHAFAVSPTPPIFHHSSLSPHVEIDQANAFCCPPNYSFWTSAMSFTCQNVGLAFISSAPHAVSRLLPSILISASPLRPDPPADSSPSAEHLRSIAGVMPTSCIVPSDSLDRFGEYALLRVLNMDEPVPHNIPTLGPTSISVATPANLNPPPVSSRSSSLLPPSNTARSSAVLKPRSSILPVHDPITIAPPSSSSASSAKERGINKDFPPAVHVLVLFAPPTSPNNFSNLSSANDDSSSYGGGANPSHQSVEAARAFVSFGSFRMCVRSSIIESLSFAVAELDALFLIQNSSFSPSLPLAPPVPLTVRTFMSCELATLWAGGGMGTPAGVLWADFLSLSIQQGGEGHVRSVSNEMESHSLDDCELADNLQSANGTRSPQFDASMVGEGEDQKTDLCENPLDRVTSGPHALRHMSLKFRAACLDVVSRLPWDPYPAVLPNATFYLTPYPLLHSWARGGEFHPTDGLLACDLSSELRTQTIVRRIKNYPTETHLGTTAGRASSAGSPEASAIWLRTLSQCCMKTGVSMDPLISFVVAQVDASRGTSCLDMQLESGAQLLPCHAPHAVLGENRSQSFTDCSRMTLAFSWIVLQCPLTSRHSPPGGGMAPYLSEQERNAILGIKNWSDSFMTLCNEFAAALTPPTGCPPPPLPPSVSAKTFTFKECLILASLNPPANRSAQGPSGLFCSKGILGFAMPSLSVHLAPSSLDLPMASEVAVIQVVAPELSLYGVSSNTAGDAVPNTVSFHDSSLPGRPVRTLLSSRLSALSLSRWLGARGLGFITFLAPSPLPIPLNTLAGVSSQFASMSAPLSCPPGRPLYPRDALPEKYCRLRRLEGEFLPHSIRTAAELVPHAVSCISWLANILYPIVPPVSDKGDSHGVSVSLTPVRTEGQSANVQVVHGENTTGSYLSPSPPPSPPLLSQETVHGNHITSSDFTIKIVSDDPELDGLSSSSNSLSIHHHAGNHAAKLHDSLPPFPEFEGEFNGRAAGDDDDNLTSSSHGEDNDYVEEEEDIEGASHFEKILSPQLIAVLKALNANDKDVNSTCEQNVIGPRTTIFAPAFRTSPADPLIVPPLATSPARRIRKKSILQVASSKIAPVSPARIMSSTPTYPSENANRNNDRLYHAHDEEEFDSSDPEYEFTTSVPSPAVALGIENWPSSILFEVDEVVIQLKSSSHHALNHSDAQPLSPVSVSPTSSMATVTLFMQRLYFSQHQSSSIAGACKLHELSPQLYPLLPSNPPAGLATRTVLRLNLLEVRDRVPQSRFKKILAPGMPSSSRAVKRDTLRILLDSFPLTTSASSPSSSSPSDVSLEVSVSPLCLTLDQNTLELLLFLRSEASFAVSRASASPTAFDVDSAAWVVSASQSAADSSSLGGGAAGMGGLPPPRRSSQKLLAPSSSRQNTHQLLPGTKNASDVAGGFTDSGDATPRFFRSLRVSAVSLKLSYEPRRCNLGSLRQGDLIQVLNLIPLVSDLKVSVPPISASNIVGDALVQSLLLEHTLKALKAEKVHLALTVATAPIRSLLQTELGDALVNVILKVGPSGWSNKDTDFASNSSVPSSSGDMTSSHNMQHYHGRQSKKQQSQQQMFSMKYAHPGGVVGRMTARMTETVSSVLKKVLSPNSLPNIPNHLQNNLNPHHSYSHAASGLQQMRATNILKMSARSNNRNNTSNVVSSQHRILNRDNSSFLSESQLLAEGFEPLDENGLLFSAEDVQERRKTQDGNDWTEL